MRDRAHDHLGALAQTATCDDAASCVRLRGRGLGGDGDSPDLRPTCDLACTAVAVADRSGGYGRRNLHVGADTNERIFGVMCE